MLNIFANNEKYIIYFSEDHKRRMSSSVGNFDPLDPKYGVDLNKYPNDNEVTWSYPAEKDGYEGLKSHFIKNNICD